MTLPNLLDIKGIGPVYSQRVEEGLNEEEITLRQVFTLSPEEIKKKFHLPINAARAIANAYTPEEPPEKKTSDKSSESLPSVAKPITYEHFSILHRDDEDYPAKLLRILGEKSPDTLYIWGNLDLLDKPGVGFCGSRDVTDKGLDVTRDVTEQIAERGWVTVSGHARGVDATAHRTALENNAGTIIVLPQGIDGFKLRMELRRYAKYENLLIISEFPPKAGWNVGYAMTRNSTIIGLSDAMVLVESRSKGGTFNAGKTALKLKHPLFVVRFQDTHKSNAGNDYFIQHGATQLLKSRKTNRANIKNIIAEVEKRQSNPERQITPKQLLMGLDE